MAAPGGWRDLGDLDADGVDSLLPTEGFAVMNRWAVAEGKAGAFELAMDAGPSASQPAGLKFRSLLRCSKMQSEEGGGKGSPRSLPNDPPNEPPISLQ